MFKKNVWIVGLLAALAIMFAGCVDALVEDDSGVETVVTDLQAIIKDVPVQVLNEDKWNAIFDNTPFKMCGESNGTFEIVEVSGKKALKVSQMTANWGVGFDARSATNASAHVKGINFKAGDVITIKGSTDLADGIALNAKGENGMSKLSNWSGTGNFETTVTVTSAEATEIKSNSAKGSLRIHGGGDSGPGRIGTIILEEFKVVGKRGAADVEPPPKDYLIPSTGTYVPPTATSVYEVYLDFNGAKYSELNGDDDPTAEISATKLSIKYKTGVNRQAVYIPFSDDLKALIKAAAGAGYTITVTIDATLGGLTDYRWAITNGKTSEWATSNIISNALTGVLNNLSDQNSDPNGFIFQSNGATLGTGVDITSIKFVFAGGSVTLPKAISDKAIKISFPLAGWIPSSGIDSTEVTGTVKFLPTPIFGKFEKNSTYYAVITITPKAGIYIPADTTFIIEDGVGVLSTPDNKVDQLYYEPIAGTITTKAFAATGATDVPNPTEGAYDNSHGTFTQETGSTIKFEFQKYLTDNTLVNGAGASDLVAPLRNAGNNITLLNKGLNVIQPQGDGWATFDLSFTGDNSLNLDMATKSYKITVWGNLNGAPASSTKAIFHVPYSGSPWNSATIGSSASLTNSFEKFEFSGTIAPSDWETWTAADPAGTIDRIRIRMEDDTPFRICGIWVEELP